MDHVTICDLRLYYKRKKEDQTRLCKFLACQAFLANNSAASDIYSAPHHRQQRAEIYIYGVITPPADGCDSSAHRATHKDNHMICVKYMNLPFMPELSCSCTTSAANEICNIVLEASQAIVLEASQATSI
jgi:Ni,Fe-hydrogenase I small subunit